MMGGGWVSSSRSLGLHVSGQPMPGSSAIQPFGRACTARFLVVDDEPALLRAVRRVLQAAAPDWKVVCARHGGEALECLSKDSFDAVLLDLHMPIMDGLTLLRHLVAQYPSVRRIVHSSHIDPMLQALLADLADDVLAKPAHSRLIIDALERSLVRGVDPRAREGQPRPTAPGMPTC